MFVELKVTLYSWPDDGFITCFRIQKRKGFKRVWGMGSRENLELEF